MTVPRNYKSRSRQGDLLARDRSPRGAGTPEKHVFEVLSEQQDHHAKRAEKRRAVRHEGRNGPVTLPKVSIPGVRSEFTTATILTPDRPFRSRLNPQAKNVKPKSQRQDVK